MSLDDFNEYYNTDYESEHSVTLGGFVIEKFGRIPDEKETITIDTFFITVQKVAEHRILELLVKQIEKPISDQKSVEEENNKEEE